MRSSFGGQGKRVCISCIDSIRPKAVSCSISWVSKVRVPNGSSSNRFNVSSGDRAARSWASWEKWTNPPSF